jgi:hypothetical protein
MATNNPEPKSKKAPRINRFAIGFNVLVQLALVFFIIAGINYIGFKHFKRWDFSRDQKYVLSDQTRQVLGGLQKPVKLYLILSQNPQLPGADVLADVQTLIKEYQYAAGGNMEVETVDIDRNLSRARELASQYKFGEEDAVIIVNQGRSKLIKIPDMAQYDTSGEMTGQPPKLIGFNGEQALTSAIIEVTEEKTNHIYFIGGKGGPELSSDELSVLKTYLERQNLAAQPLTLMNAPAIPDDAKVVMLIGAKYDLTDRELQLLKDYWDKQGRLFIALDPSGNTPKLDAWLRGLGINPQDDRVLRTVAMGTVTGIMTQVAGSFSETSPVTRKLQGVDTLFIGQTQSLGITVVPEIHTDTLLTAGEGYWGETKYQDIEKTGVSYDPKEDISAPLAIAVSAEKGALQDAAVNVDSSRMIVTGNSDFIGSQALAQAEPNLDFALDSINWLLNRTQLIGIAPKAERQFTLNLNDQQMQRMELLVMVVMPVSIAMLGAFVWAQRRR